MHQLGSEAEGSSPLHELHGELMHVSTHELNAASSKCSQKQKFYDVSLGVTAGNLSQALQDLYCDGEKTRTWFSVLPPTLSFHLKRLTWNTSSNQLQKVYK